MGTSRVNHANWSTTSVCLVLSFFFLLLANTSFATENSYKYITASPVLHFGDPTTPYKLKNSTGPNAHQNWASENQDICTLNLLQGYVKNGFFVEAGGYDGENLSNTLYLERYHNWTGVLIEPNPHLFRRILPLNRRCAAVNAGISTVAHRAIEISFRLAGPLGGIVSHLTSTHETRIKNELRSTDNTSWAHLTEGQGEVVSVNCYPLEQLVRLARANLTTSTLDTNTKLHPRARPRANPHNHTRTKTKSHTHAHTHSNTPLVVDYFSLDTEGSELAILRSIDFTQITFGIVGIEHNNRPGWKDEIGTIMKGAGYVQFTHLSWAMGHADVLYYNPVYFRQRGIPLPTDRMKCP